MVRSTNFNKQFSIVFKLYSGDIYNTYDVGFVGYENRVIGEIEPNNNIIASEVFLFLRPTGILHFIDIYTNVSCISYSPSTTAVSPCISNRKHVDVFSHLDLSCHGTWRPRGFIATATIPAGFYAYTHTHI